MPRIGAAIADPIAAVVTAFGALCRSAAVLQPIAAVVTTLGALHRPAAVLHPVAEVFTTLGALRSLSAIVTTLGALRSLSAIVAALCALCGLPPVFAAVLNPVAAIFAAFSALRGLAPVLSALLRLFAAFGALCGFAPVVAAVLGSIASIIALLRDACSQTGLAAVLRPLGALRALPIPAAILDARFRADVGPGANGGLAVVGAGPGLHPGLGFSLRLGLGSGTRSIAVPIGSFRDCLSTRRGERYRRHACK